MLTSALPLDVRPLRSYVGGMTSHAAKPHPEQKPQHVPAHPPEEHPVRSDEELSQMMEERPQETPGWKKRDEEVSRPQTAPTPKAPPAPAPVPGALHPFVRTGSGEWTCPQCKFVETEPGKLLVRSCPVR